MTACPACGAELPAFDGWPVWCPACEWGLPTEGMTPSRPRGGWFGQLRREWADAADSRIRAELLADPDRLRRPDAGRHMVLGAAIAVHAITVGLVVLDVLLWLTSVVPVLKIGATLLIGGIVLVVAPIRWPQRRRGHQLRPVDAPRTFAALDAIASAVGTRSPQIVVPTADFAITMPDARTVRIGLPLWHLLSTDGRVAALAHVLAHQAVRDLRRAPVVASARRSLDEWRDLLRPDPASAKRRSRRAGRRSSPARTVAMSELLLPVALAPLYGMVAAVAYLVDRRLAEPGVRAEFAADAVAVSAVGVGGARDLLDAGLLVETARSELALAARDREADLLAAASSYAIGVPERERERLRRIARRTRHRVDEDHPPTASRFAVVDALEPPVAPLLTAGVAEGIETEWVSVVPDVVIDLRANLADVR